MPPERSRSFFFLVLSAIDIQAVVVLESEDWRFRAADCTEPRVGGAMQKGHWNYRDVEPVFVASKERGDDFGDVDRVR